MQTMTNDRLKFRVWNNISNDFVDGTLNNDGFFELDMFSFEEKHGDDWDNITDDGVNIIEQCTGLKDKNGKLIYEGDIVSYKVPSGKYSGVVRWDKNTGGWLKSTGGDALHTYIKTVEVIGNIHENKGLLND